MYSGYSIAQNRLLWWKSRYFCIFGIVVSQWFICCLLYIALWYIPVDLQEDNIRPIQNTHLSFFFIFPFSSKHFRCYLTALHSQCCPFSIAYTFLFQFQLLICFLIYLLLRRRACCLSVYRAAMKTVWSNQVCCC